MAKQGIYRAKMRYREKKQKIKLLNKFLKIRYISFKTKPWLTNFKPILHSGHPWGYTTSKYCSLPFRLNAPLKHFLTCLFKSILFDLFIGSQSWIWIQELWNSRCHALHQWMVSRTEPLPKGFMQTGESPTPRSHDVKN